MLESREIALRSIRFKSAERIPYLFYEWGPNDFKGLTFGTDRITIDNIRERDEFGCVWEKPKGHTIGYVIDHPLYDLKRLDNYTWPDPDIVNRYTHLKEEASSIREQGLAVTCGYLGMLWERLWFLHGFENSLINIYQNPDVIEEILDRLTEYAIRLCHNSQEASEGSIDIWCSTDDWGLQSTTFIPREVFVRMFKPRYARIFEACHKEGMHTFLHSDGKINSLLTDFIDIGLDIIQIEDIRVKGIKELVPFRGKITFQCTLDAQSTMPGGDRKAIRAESREITEHLATPEGGLIASIYWDPASCGISNEIQKIGVQSYIEACESYVQKNRK